MKSSKALNRLAFGCIFAFEIFGPGGRALAVDNAAIQVYNSGNEALAAKHLPEAERYFKQATDIDPSFSVAHWNLGVVRTQLRRYDEALPELQKAVALDPHAAGAWNSLGVCLVGMGRTPEAVAAFRKYLQLEPNGPMAANLRNAIPVLEGEAKRLSSRPASEADYYQQSLASHFGHWDRMPITVCIEPARNVRGFRPEFVDIMKKAFTDWVGCSNGEISFALTNDPSKAQMKCMFTDSRKDSVNSSEGGHCYARQSDKGVIESAEISVMTVTPVGLDLTDGVVRRVCLHEIGHALGLGHSSNAKDIMYIASLATTVDVPLSERDARTLQRMYHGVAVAKTPPATSAESNAVSHASADVSLPVDANGLPSVAGNASSSVAAAASTPETAATLPAAQVPRSIADPAVSANQVAVAQNSSADPSATAQVALVPGSTGDAMKPMDVSSAPAAVDEQKKKARQLVEVGNRLIKSGLLAAGIAQLEDAYRQSGDDPFCAASLGIGYGMMADDAMEQKDSSQAEQYYQKAIPLLERMPNQNLPIVLKQYSTLLHALHRDNDAQAIDAKLGSLNVK